MLLSAAHCLMLPKNVSIVAANIGGTKAKNYQDMMKIPGSQLHFEPVNDLDDGDIGIINLDTPIIPTDAVQPIRIAPRNSKLPKTLIFTKWLNFDIDNMDLEQETVNVIDQEECLRIYQSFNKTIDFYGKNNKYGRPILFCTDGGYIQAGNSGTPLIATDENNYAFALLSSGPTRKSSVPNIFVDLRAFLDEIDVQVGKSKARRRHARDIYKRFVHSR